MMKQTAPMEAGLPVADLEKMLGFYTQVLGFTEVRRSDIPAPLSVAIRTARDGYLNVWLQTPGGEVLKLMSPVTPPVLVEAPEHSADRTGFAYLTFYVGNIDEVVEVAVAHGAKVRSEPSALSGDFGVRLVFFEDPEGNVIELVEPAA